MQDLHFATLLCQVANLNRDPKRRPFPYEVEEFLVFGNPASEPVERAEPVAAPKPQQTVEDMKRMAEAFTTGLGGTRIDRRKEPA